MHSNGKEIVYKSSNLMIILNIHRNVMLNHHLSCIYKIVVTTKKFGCKMVANLLNQCTCFHLHMHWSVIVYFESKL